MGGGVQEGVREREGKGRGRDAGRTGVGSSRLEFQRVVGAGEGRLYLDTPTRKCKRH